MSLIRNADDFGLSESINKGIVYGIKVGVIISTNIMINMPATSDAIGVIKNH